MRSFQASTERRKEDPTSSVGEELDLSAHRLQGLFIYSFIWFFLFVYVVNLCLFPFVPEIIVFGCVLCQTLSRRSLLVH